MITRFRVLIPRTVVCCMLGCSNPGVREGDAPRNVEAQPTLTHDGILRRLDTLPSWPTDSPHMNAQQWLALARTAEDMQHADSTTLRESLTDFVKSGSGPYGELKNASKAVLLLRMMFEIPSEPYDENRHPIYARPGGFSGGYDGLSDSEIASLGQLLSWPIRWRSGLPELVASLGGYNGPPYDVGRDLIKLRENYRFRNLGPVIKQLEERVTRTR